MARGNWRKLKNLKPLILEVLKKAKFPKTTNQIKKSLESDKVVSWYSAIKILKELEIEGVVNRIKLNKINIWELKK